MDMLIGIALLLLPLVQPFGIWMITASHGELTNIEGWFPVRGRWTRYWGYLLVLVVPVVWCISALASTSGDSGHTKMDTVPLSSALVIILFLDSHWILLSMGLVGVVRWISCQIRQAHATKAIRPECSLRSRSRI